VIHNRISHKGRGDPCIYHIEVLSRCSHAPHRYPRDLAAVSIAINFSPQGAALIRMSAALQHMMISEQFNK